MDTALDTSRDQHSHTGPGTVSTSLTPAHSLFAHLGKKVLRPGGIEMTRMLLSALTISSADDVVEIAPGRGSTTSMVLDADPRSYVGIDRDHESTDTVEALFEGGDRKAVNANAMATGLDDASADVVFGEAYLTMQPDSVKQRIIAELARVLRPGGRFALHEMAILPDDIDDADRVAITHELTSSSNVRVSPMTPSGWTALLEEHGIIVKERFCLSLHLLEPRRFLADEGLMGTARFGFNVARDGDARRRVLALRRAMASNSEHLCAHGIIGVRTDS